MRASYKERGLARLLRWGSALLTRSGNSALAALLFRTADKLAPVDLPPFTYARALWQDGQYHEAKNVLQKILAVTPQDPEANNLIGVIFLEEDDAESAHPYFRRAIDERLDFPAAHNNLGNIHRARGQLEEAERSYRTALHYKPDYVEALTNLGAVLNLQEDNEAAENYCRKAVELAPSFAGAHCNLGNVLLSLGRSGEAVAEYREALRLQPGIPEALVNLALIMEDGGYLAGTIDYYEKQLLRQPHNHLPNVRIAQALQALERWDEARQRLDIALQQKPEAADALFILGVNYAHIGDIRAGIDCQRRALASGHHAMAESAIIFDSIYLEDCTGEYLCASYRDWAENYATRPLLSQHRDRDEPERRLRVGYVSRDFARHSVAYFLEPILKHHDRSRFEIFCYSTLIQGDEYTERFKTLADAWRDISPMSENKAADLVMADGIDILIDLSGHTTGTRLGVFARKPAPVQISYLGHPATTGLSTIDYRLGDLITDPTGQTANHYVEHIWQLPDCFLTYQPMSEAPQVAPSPVQTKGHITFGSFNNAAKINDHVIAVWAEILKAVPSAHLFLKSYAFASSHGRERLVKGFAFHGIAQDRLRLINWSPDASNHLELYREIDIALDPFPYNGTTTTCEALWMGVPVVSLTGVRHSGRVGACLLTTLGMEELLANDTGEYVRIAVALACDVARLETLRNSSRERMRASPLLDHAKFTRQLEHAYREMWRIYCERRVTDKTLLATDGASIPADKTVSLDLAGIATICLPDSYEVMTRYVVEEQGDWFEDEIHFVRKMLMPGQVAIDVGANYGVYTLSMSAVVGASGKVFAFEPDTTTAGQLRASVDANQFRQADIIERAVSDVEGRGHFKVDSNAELSRLVDTDESTDQDVGVDITTLDRCRNEFHWNSVDFIKIDAEGQEPNVVRGGRQLLTECSPLVMAEYKHGLQLNHLLLEEFARLGFQAYRLIPGLMLLAPVADVAAADPYLLNLFFCTDDKAEALSARGLLAPRNRSKGTDAQPKNNINPGWRAHLSSLAYAKDRTDHWRNAEIGDKHLSNEDENVLNLYVRAQEANLPPSERLAALTQSLQYAETNASTNPTLARQLTLARIRADIGMRNEAMKMFAQVLDGLQHRDEQVPDVPFLAPSRQFEQIECHGKLRDWTTAAVAEWLASRTGFSSFFTADDSLRYLQIVRRSGFIAAGARKRIDLILQRRRTGVSRASGN